MPKGNRQPRTEEWKKNHAERIRKWWAKPGVKEEVSALMKEAKRKEPDEDSIF